jgi:hypothetical protein
METGSKAVLDALIEVSELERLAPPPLEMQGFPKRRQTRLVPDAARGG